MIELTATRKVDDHGTIVIFEGYDEEGETYFFAADHRPARQIETAIAHTNGEASVRVPAYMLLLPSEAK